MPRPFVAVEDDVVVVVVVAVGPTEPTFCEEADGTSMDGVAIVVDDVEVAPIDC